MRVILIGKSSGRLDCLAEALARNHNIQLFILTNYSNPGLQAKGFVAIGPTEEPDFVTLYASFIKESDTLAIISNEEPLAAGIADRLIAIGIPTFGPVQAAAQIETSKIWMRMLLDKHGLGRLSPDWQAFDSNDTPIPDDNLTTAGGYISYMNYTDCEIVIKPEGLTGGKGVRVQGDHFMITDEAIVYTQELFAAGGRVLIEEKLNGQEFSRMCFSDGKTVIPMPAVQDHKRLGEGDTGINTGGMGSYSDVNHSLPFLDPEDVEMADYVNEMVVRAIQLEIGSPFVGVLYGNFIATSDGIKLIEYNARFGDPEVMNVLPLLETDFVKLCHATATGNLQQHHVKFAHKATVCKYVLPEDYPDSKTWDHIDLTQIEPHPDLHVYHGALDWDTMTGSRAAALVGIGVTIAEAEQIAERAVQQVHGPVYHRSDIGTPVSIARRVEHLRELRNPTEPVDLFLD